jgi:hypothetical protein
MGNLKQASTLAMLYNRTLRANHEQPMTAEQEAGFRATVLEADLAEVRAMFAEVNEILKFDRKTSHATSEQLQVIRSRERRAFGEARTSYRDGLTFEEAHKRIQSLKGAAHA